MNCLHFITPGMPPMACYLEFLVFPWNTKVASPRESRDFIIFLAMNDFLNVAKSHLNTLFFKVLVALFRYMNVLYVILIKRAQRIQTEPCRLDDALKKQKLFISNEPLVKSWGKCFTSILKWIQFSVEVDWIYCFSNTISAKDGSSWSVDTFY